MIGYFGIHPVLFVFTGKCCLQCGVFRAECNVQFTLKCAVFAVCTLPCAARFAMYSVYCAGHYGGSW